MADPVVDRVVGEAVVGAQVLAAAVLAQLHEGEKDVMVRLGVTKNGGVLIDRAEDEEERRRAIDEADARDDERRSSR